MGYGAEKRWHKKKEHSQNFSERIAHLRKLYPDLPYPVPYFDWRKTNGRIPDSDDEYTNLWDTKDMDMGDIEDLVEMLNLGEK